MSSDSQTRRRLNFLGSLAAAVFLVIVAGGLLVHPRFSPLAHSLPPATLLPVGGSGVNLPIVAGWYYVENGGHRYSFHLPASGFVSTSNGSLQTGSPSNKWAYATLAFLGNPSFVYSEPCHWRRATQVTTGTTASDFVTAVAAIQTLSHLALDDTTIDGHPAKQQRIGLGKEPNLATCDDREARSYEGSHHRRQWSVEDLTAIDLENGERGVVLVGYLSGLDPRTYELLRYVVDSVRIAPITP